MTTEVIMLVLESRDSSYKFLLFKFQRQDNYINASKYQLSEDATIGDGTACVLHRQELSWLLILLLASGDQMNALLFTLDHISSLSIMVSG